MACIPSNPRRVGYIVPVHGPLDGPLYMGSIYTNILIIAIAFTNLPTCDVELIFIILSYLHSCSGNHVLVHGRNNDSFFIIFHRSFI